MENNLQLKQIIPTSHKINLIYNLNGKIIVEPVFCLAIVHRVEVNLEGNKEEYDEIVPVTFFTGDKIFDWGDYGNSPFDDDNYFGLQVDGKILGMEEGENNVDNRPE